MMRCPIAGYPGAMGNQRGPSDRLVVKLKTVFAKKIDISKTEQKDMEENDVAEKSLDEAIDSDEVN